MMMRQLWKTLLLVLLLSSCSQAQTEPPVEPNVEPRDYDDNGDPLRGFLSLPNVTDPAPAVVIIPDIDGTNEYEQIRATMLAQDFGWIGFAADIYGFENGTDLNEAALTNTTLRRELYSYYAIDNRTAVVSRIQAAVDYVRTLPEVDASNVAVIGYCFGGSAVLIYGVSGTSNVNAIVSFHGGLNVVPNATSAGTSKILVLSGGEDDMSSEIIDLENNLNAANADWEITRYSGIEHAFTVFEDDRYNAFADMRSWESMYNFLQEAFGEIAYDGQEPEVASVEAVPYEDVDGTQLQSYIALPSDAWIRPLPAVVIVPDWDGVNEYEQKRATLLAESGYVGFAADIYGAELQTNLTIDQRRNQTTLYRGNPELFIQRIQRAIDQVKTYSTEVDMDNIAIIGYCFGGSGVVYYGFSGATDAKVAVAFHGGLSQLPEAVTDISAYMLIESGGIDDQHGNQTVLEAALNMGNADWEITRYSGVDHGFTAWESGAYSLKADARSWEKTLTILEERMFAPLMATTEPTPADTPTDIPAVVSTNAPTDALSDAPTDTLSAAPTSTATNIPTDTPAMGPVMPPVLSPTNTKAPSDTEDIEETSGAFAFVTFRKLGVTLSVVAAIMFGL